MCKTLFISAALAVTATSLFAHDYKVGDLEVAHPYSFETAKTAMARPGYLTITNTGDTADTLAGVEADFGRIELHTTEVDDAGVARMIEQEDGIIIGAGETVELLPGGLHIMFMGLNGDPLEEGEEFPATLIFENSGTLEVIFNVESRSDAMKEMDHSTMNHDVDADEGEDEDSESD